jgi:FixJ family two-component response regulator
VVNTLKNVIYVVDDDVSVCKSLTLLLTSHGMRVETFTRAAGFLEYKHPKVPSCLLLDVSLPDLNGLALQEVMAQRGMVVPTVFITGHGDIPMSVKTMKAGAIDFLPKPFSVR